MAFQSDPANRTTTSTMEMAPWIEPYAKAYLERQWIDSSKPYQAYPGFLQSMKKDMAPPEPVKRPWDALTGSNFALPGKSTGIVPDNLGFKPLIAGLGFNPLTARQGEQVPLPLDQTDYNRYITSLMTPGANLIDPLRAIDYNKWKKQNKRMAKYMDQPISLKNAKKYGGYLSNQYAGAKNEQMPGMFDQYYAANILGK